MVGGRDRLRFLHAVTTQDVAKLAPGAGVHGAMTDDRGRPVSDFLLYVLPEAILLEAPAGAADALRAALERLVVADDVTLAWAQGDAVVREDLAPGGAGKLAVEWGAGTDPAVDQDLSDELTLALVPARRRAVLHASRFGGAGTLSWGGEAGAGGLPEEDLDALEIAAFRPGPAEFTAARVWNELDLMETVSFTKGCFTGQEILNRVQTRGQLQRRLVALLLEAGAWPRGAWTGAVLETGNGEPVGEIVRAAGDRAFAFVARDAWESGTHLVARQSGAPSVTCGAIVQPRSTSEVP
ncbi:MAG: hypothetical protein ABI960_05940 [Candidatus Eisenbacteria bacterium]